MNLGRTCYMNATLQALLACGTAWRRVADEAQPQATEIRRRTREFFRAVRSPGSRAVFSPWALWRAVRDACPEFDNTRPHDAPHFLLSLRRELARAPGIAEPSPAWAAWLSETDLLVTTRTYCTQCGLADNHPPHPEPMVMGAVEESPAESSVRGVVASWFGPTPLDADWKCDRCRSPTGAKAQKCRNLPRVLVVWLQRFRREGQVEWKVEAPVRGIEEEIDLTPHLDVVAGAPGGTSAAGGPGGARYQARAIVCHHGSKEDGHYTCWIRKEAGRGAAPAAAATETEDRWLRYSDSSVGRPAAELPPDVAKSAYLLFCERAPCAAADAPPPAVVEIDAEPGPIGGSAGGAAVGHGEDTKGRPADDAEMQDGEEHDVEMLDM